MRSLFIIFVFIAILPAFGQSENCIQDWIQENYQKDCKMLIREKLYRNQQSTYIDSAFISREELAKYLTLFSAVYAVNDSVFTKYNCKASYERRTSFYLELDPAEAWVKKLQETNGAQTGNKAFDDLLKKYGIKITHIDASGPYLEMYSTEILNFYAILDELLKIKGVVSDIPGIGLAESPTVICNPEKGIVEFFHYPNNADFGDEAVIYWKYQVTDCQATLVNFYDHTNY
jgi:hypothetical protein